MKEITEIFTIILLFGGVPSVIVFVFYTLHNSRHKEKLALIEKGIDISASKKEINPLQRVLMWALLLIGVGMGLIIGYLLS